MSNDARGRESQVPITMNGKNTNTHSIVSILADIKSTGCLGIKIGIFDTNFGLFSRDCKL